MEEKFGFYDTGASGATSCELSARDRRMIERGRAARYAFYLGSPEDAWSERTGEDALSCRAA